MNRQQFFNDAVTALLAQGELGRDIMGNAYITRNGTCCLIGGTLTPELKKSLVTDLNNTMGISTMSERDLIICELTTKYGYSINDDEDFIAEMQQCHDHSNNFTQCIKALATRGSQYSLDVSILTPIINTQNESALPGYI